MAASRSAPAQAATVRRADRTSLRSRSPRSPRHKTNYIETEIDAFHGKYSDPQKSKLHLTIGRGENSLQPFELQ